MSLIFEIGKKHYFVKKNNYLIIDFLNIEIGKNIIFKKNFFLKKNFFNYSNIKIKAVVLKHFLIKINNCKKKRRKQYIKNIFNYKKKTLIFIQNII